MSKRQTKTRETNEWAYSREQWKALDSAWFEYHCEESHSSADAQAWYRSHQTVLVLGELDGASGSSKNFPDSKAAVRAEKGLPRMYRVRFPDGLEWDVFEDELLTSRKGFYRPDPKTIKEATK